MPRCHHAVVASTAAAEPISQKFWCSGGCKDYHSDHENCGGCGVACARDSERCEGGQCVSVCGGGAHQCMVLSRHFGAWARQVPCQPTSLTSPTWDHVHLCHHLPAAHTLTWLKACGVHSQLQLHQPALSHEPACKQLWIPCVGFLIVPWKQHDQHCTGAPGAAGAQQWCNGACNDYQFDLHNCGSCGNNCAWDGSEYCLGGVCSPKCSWREWCSRPPC